MTEKLRAQNVRFTEAEGELFDVLQAHLGLASRAEVFRYAIRALARTEGLLVDARFAGALPNRMQEKMQR
jgi:hypothetical protein